MSIFKDKELLLDAIDVYDFYTKHQKIVLKLLVTMSIDNTAHVGTSYLAEKTNTTVTAVYATLCKFEKEGTLKRLRQTTSKHLSYQLHEESLERFAQIYHNKKAIEDMSAVRFL